MKIPEGKYNSKLEGAFEDAATQITMESGIWVDVGKEHVLIELSYMGTQEKYPVITRLFFKCHGHEFETLNDLKKAIANKAFL